MRSTIAQIAALLALVTAALLGARFVDAGDTTGWPLAARFAWASGLLFAIVGAVLVLHRLLSPEHSDLGPNLDRDRRGPTLRKGLVIATAAFLILVAGALVLEIYVAISMERTLSLAMGLGLGWCALRKPWWFWGHWKAHLLRRIIGDVPTTLVYLMVAGVLLYLAVVGDPSKLFR